MPKLVIVVGLPGSGKSRYINTEAAEKGLKAFHDVCHPKNRFGKDALGDVVVHLIKAQACIIEDSVLCIPQYRNDVEKWLKDAVPGLAIEWVYFELAPAKCLTNILYDALSETRNDSAGRSEAFFNVLKLASYPDGIKPISVTVNPEAKQLIGQA